ncbi:Hypothetical protein, putative [Bodo saltans]|uniref:Uncharacterized protein n=1 Tax=Bodo saltans TaxID=75058 RepID=A0A0S4J075_BODSA|nr:Hypothetical protein, putative [Bodo saltans]|eukprot:CUG70413.1 Hypothetical protein, putative [Bodo saltans]
MPPTPSGAAAALTQSPSLHGRGASPSPTTNDVLSVHYLGKIITVAVDKISAKKQRHVSTSEGAAVYEPTAADLCAEVVGSTTLSTSETVLRCDGQCLRGDFLLADIPVNAKLEVRSVPPSLMSTFTTKFALPTSSRKRSRSLEDDDPASTTTVVLPVVVGNVAQWLGPSAATEKSHR